MTYTQDNNIFLIRLMPGEEVFEALTKFCKTHHLKGGFISGIGGASATTFSHLDLSTKQYNMLTFENVQVNHITGNISVEGMHLHITVGDAEGKTFGGHMQSCVADPTIELMLTPFKETHREYDEYSTLNLLTLDQTL